MTHRLPGLIGAFMVLFGALLYVVFDGYLRVLRLACRFTPHRGGVEYEVATGAPLVTICVLITVHNEAQQIVARVQNVLSQDYPAELLEVVIASDGSTDDLESVVTENFGDQVRVIHSELQVGKSTMQNRALESIQSSVVQFTDAATRFAPGFLREIAKPFADERVGAVQAHLLFVPRDPSTGPASQARYWRAELEIRQLEDRLGILAVTSGACVAMRRELWRPLDPAFGEDCIIPLDVILQSRKVVYAAAAIAHELEGEEFENVVKSRTRMTLRNWQATWSRSELLNPFALPGYALALWSHKLLRWLTPVWLLGLSLSALALPLVSSRRLFLLPAGAVLAFYLLALVGGLAKAKGARVPVCASIYAFILANLGFLGGLIQAARGHTITRYR